MSAPRRLVAPRQRGSAGPRRQKPVFVQELELHLRRHASDLGIELTWSPILSLGATLSALVMLGVVLGGIVGAVFASCLLAAALSAASRVGSRRVKRRAQVMLPEVCVHLSRTIRSGRSVEEAFDGVAAQVAPLTLGVARVASESSKGRPITEALEAWAARSESSAEQLVSTALLVGVQHGGDLGTTLDVVGGGLRDDLDLAARRRVLLVQATMSAAVLVTLPVAFAVVASVLHGGSLVRGPSGAVVVSAGLLLDALGSVWMRSLMRGLK